MSKKNIFMSKKNIFLSLIIITTLFMIPSVSAVANFRVTSFACSPEEVKLTEQFSCTATIQNNGDSTGSLSTVTLYPDNTNWLEKASYPVTSGANVNSGVSTEVTFSNLKAKKSGNAGFSKIMLDSVTDTYVADNAETVNVIDIITVATSTESSAAAGATVDVTGQATIGGNTDTTLTFRVNSGGCSIGNQDASATTTGMTNGQTMSHSWTVTMGTSTCSYTIEGKVISKPSGVASKTDSGTGTITCSSGCSSSESGSSGGGSAASGGGSTGSSKNATKTTAPATEPKSESATSEETAKVAAPQTTEEVKTQEPKTEMPKGKQWLIPVVFLAIIGLAVFLYRKYEM